MEGLEFKNIDKSIKEFLIAFCYLKENGGANVSCIVNSITLVCKVDGKYFSHLSKHNFFSKDKQISKYFPLLNAGLKMDSKKERQVRKCLEFAEKNSYEELKNNLILSTK